MISKETQYAFVHGDERAFEAVINTYSNPLLRYCVTILCNREEAKDVVQETFIKAYEKRKRFDPETSINSWLYRIAYTTSIDAIRKREYRARLANLIQINNGEESGHESISEPLYSILLSLSVKERTLLYGRVLEDKPYKELALILNSSETALRKRYERLIRKLAQKAVQGEPYVIKINKECIE